MTTIYPIKPSPLSEPGIMAKTIILIIIGICLLLKSIGYYIDYLQSNVWRTGGIMLMMVYQFVYVVACSILLGKKSKDKVYEAACFSYFFSYIIPIIVCFALVGLASILLLSEPSRVLVASYAYPHIAIDTAQFEDLETGAFPLEVEAFDYGYLLTPPPIGIGLAVFAVYLIAVIISIKEAVKYYKTSDIASEVPVMYMWPAVFTTLLIIAAASAWLISC